MQRLIDEGLVESDGVSFIESVDDRGVIVHVTIRGRLRCRGGLLIRVDKKLDVRRGRSGRLEVRTYSYQYHAWIHGRAGYPRRNVIRYDNSPVHDHQLHRHDFDGAGNETSVSAVEFADLPTLSEFVRLVHELAGMAP